MNIGDQVQKNGADYKPVGEILTITEVEDHRVIDGNISKKSGDIRVNLSDGSWSFPWNLTWLTIEGE